VSASASGEPGPPAAAGPARPRALLIANPVAHRVTAAKRNEAIEVLAAAFDLEPATTKAPGHATELAAGAVDANVDVVLVLGGDGTLNEVAQGLARTPIPMAVLPGGEANVLARSLGIPTDVREAASFAVDRIGSDGGVGSVRSRAIPLGRIGERWFVASCGVGFDAAIVRDVERNPAAKRRGGDLFFLWTGLRLFFAGYDRREPQLDISWGPDLSEGLDGAFLAVVQNLDPYTYFGRRPMRLCPDVRLDGGIDLLSLDSFRARHVLPVAVSTFARARHPKRRHVVYVRDQPGLRVRCRRPMPAQADGEYLGEVSEVYIESVPNALRVVA
jgi:diacylglycerol kinase family enzyme